MDNCNSLVEDFVFWILIGMFIGTGARALKLLPKDELFAGESENCPGCENVLNSSCSRLVSPFGSILAQLGDWHAKPQLRKSICHSLVEFNMVVS